MNTTYMIQKEENWKKTICALRKDIYSRRDGHTKDTEAMKTDIWNLNIITLGQNIKDYN